VHNFVAHINGGAKALQGQLNDVDGAVNPGAKTPRLGQ
jgi:hypothetical protein